MAVEAFVAADAVPMLLKAGLSALILCLSSRCQLTGGAGRSAMQLTDNLTRACSVVRGINLPDAFLGGSVCSWLEWS